MNGLAQSLVLKERRNATRKWPIAVIGVEPAIKERHINEANWSVQCSIEPFASFACQTTDNCDTGYLGLKLSKRGMSYPLPPTPLPQGRFVCKYFPSLSYYLIRNPPKTSPFVPFVWNSVPWLLLSLLSQDWILIMDEGWKKWPSGHPGQVDFPAWKVRFSLTCSMSKGSSKSNLVPLSLPRQYFLEVERTLETRSRQVLCQLN